MKRRRSTPSQELATTKAEPSTTKPKTGPIRTCVGCRTAGPASTLSRFVADGHSLRIGTRKPGRGAWLCTATMLECFDQATSRRSWARALRTKVDSASIEQLRAHLAEPGER